ncbi:MAG: hypothetical protein AAFU56_05530, partial [Pseudomonadota bacterium]
MNTANKTDVRAHAVTVAREIREFTSCDLAERAGISDSTALDLIHTWKSMGWVKPVPKKSRRDRQAYVTQPTLQLVGELSPETKLWQVFRVLKRGTARELVAHLEGSGLDDTLAAQFLEMCFRAGIVDRTNQSKAAGRAPLYRLKRDIGPLPPVSRRVTIVVNQNDGTILK